MLSFIYARTVLIIFRGRVVSLFHFPSFNFTVIYTFVHINNFCVVSIHHCLTRGYTRHVTPSRELESNRQRDKKTNIYLSNVKLELCRMNYESTIPSSEKAQQRRMDCRKQGLGVVTEVISMANRENYLVGMIGRIYLGLSLEKWRAQVCMHASTAKSIMNPCP